LRESSPRILRLLALACAALIAFSAHAFEAFVVKDIRLVGLQRISAGTLFSYLPIKIGDTVDDVRAAEAIRALFKTGFFEDVQFGREDELLVVTVQERPSIATVTITGNREIDTEKLTKALKDVGFSEGRVFDRSLLDKVQQELQRQYFALGKYGVKVDSKVTVRDRNRADIELEIFEGDAALIQRINIVGNNAFDDETLIEQLQLSEPGFGSFFSGSDKYSKQQLRGDLETLRSYYLDRGYINFNIESTQVTISPDKRDIYIAINVDEGEQFFVADVKLSGEMAVPREELEQRITMKSGDVFSRSVVTGISNAITDRLGDDGYAFANVNAVPDVNKTDRKVALTFFVDPGKRVYVRRINISGNTKTEEEVIRREFRQMEGGWFTPKKLQRSRVRLQRLGIFDDVSVETPAVPGTSDQVDININVVEGSTGQLQASLGYGQVGGLIVQAKIAFNNFVGTGKYMSLEATRNRSQQVYNFSYTNPYYTDDGVSRGINLFYRKTNAGESNIGDYDADDQGVRVNYGFPISEFNSTRVGIELKETNLRIDSDSAQVYKDWVCDFYDEEPGGTYNLCRQRADFTTATLDTSFSKDTRNRTFFASEGQLQQVSAEVTLPWFDLQYYKLRYNYESNWPLFAGLVLQGRASLGYGDGYGDTKDLPFFENFYAGGVNSVRGFRGNSLGTPATKEDEISLTVNDAGEVISTSVKKDEIATGGSLRTVANLELIFPLPFAENSKSFRVSTFLDAGNVFDGVGDFEVGELRTSYGFQALWVTPVGVLTFSWGWPFDSKPGDEREVFQFYIGAPF
jgi:outer membrane protein insertion porin family